MNIIHGLSPRLRGNPGRSRAQRPCIIALWGARLVVAGIPGIVWSATCRATGVSSRPVSYGRDEFTAMAVNRGCLQPPMLEQRALRNEWPCVGCQCRRPVGRPVLWVLKSNKITFGNAASGLAIIGLTPACGATDHVHTFGRCRNLLPEVPGQDSVAGRRARDNEKRPPRASGGVCGLRYQQVPNRRL